MRVFAGVRWVCARRCVIGGNRVGVAWVGAARVVRGQGWGAWRSVASRAALGRDTRPRSRVSARHLTGFVFEPIDWKRIRRRLCSCTSHECATHASRRLGCEQQRWPREHGGEARRGEGGPGVGLHTKRGERGRHPPLARTGLKWAIVGPSLPASPSIRQGRSSIFASTLLFHDTRRVRDRACLCSHREPSW